MMAVVLNDRAMATLGRSPLRGHPNSPAIGSPGRTRVTLTTATARSPSGKSAATPDAVRTHISVEMAIAVIDRRATTAGARSGTECAVGGLGSALAIATSSR